MLIKIVLLFLFIAIVLVISAFIYEPSRTKIDYFYGKLRGGYTVEERLDQYGHRVTKRLKPFFEKAGVKYPPAEVAYLAFKDASQLEVYSRENQNQSWIFIRSYPIVKMSGKLGPKLKEGDRQVPEGIYQSELLNPNSRYHLSIRVSYPNSFDRDMARLEDRHNLGGDIMIHGSSVSIGCLAMGNAAAEDLFILSAMTLPLKTKIIISPTDFRLHANYLVTQGSPWVNTLYDQLRLELAQFKKN